jgi:hypothetical protein
MSEEMLLVGDDAVHGEDAYAFSDLPPAILYADTEQAPPSGDIESASPKPHKNSSSNNGGAAPDPPQGAPLGT